MAVATGSKSSPVAVVRTQHQLAKLAGVSQVTVHRVLSGHSAVTEEVRERVLRLAESTGYRVNASGKAMREKRFGCITLLCGTDDRFSRLPEGLMAGILRGAEQHDISVAMASLPDDRLVDPSYIPHALRKWMSDGLLIKYDTSIPAALEQHMARWQIPSVWLNSKHASDAVHPDEFQGGREAAESLLRLGHRRLAFASYVHPGDASRGEFHYSFTDRLAGAQSGAAAYGCACPRVGAEEFWQAGQMVSDLRQMLSVTDRPTGLICYGPREAHAAQMAAVSLGLRVPEDLSIIMFTGGLDRDWCMNFDYIRIPEHECGYEGVKMLLGKLERNDKAPVLPLAMSHIAGASVAPAHG
jgi:LacI family transcriptional regulator